MQKFLLAAVLGSLAMTATSQASIVFDNFNTNEGHFTSNPSGGSGSTNGIAATSTADRVTTTAVEGVGSQLISLDVSAASVRLRHLSGAGTPANNTNFLTGAGTDGWIGFYVKTNATGWNVQLYIEPGSVAPAATGSNGSIPKNLIADGEWHLYEWNLDDTTGGADGWGSIAGIVSGAATVANGNHSIDSILFRNPASTSGTNASFFLDYVAKSDAGSIATLVPEPASFSLLALAAAPLLRRRRA